jgi:hypothetical protein
MQPQRLLPSDFDVESAHAALAAVSAWPPPLFLPALPLRGQDVQFLESELALSLPHLFENAEALLGDGRADSLAVGPRHQVVHVLQLGVEFELGGPEGRGSPFLGTHCIQATLQLLEAESGQVCLFLLLFDCLSPKLVVLLRAESPELQETVQLLPLETERLNHLVEAVGTTPCRQSTYLAEAPEVSAPVPKCSPAEGSPPRNSEQRAPVPAPGASS